MLEHLNPKMAVEFAIKTEELGAQGYEKLARRFKEDAELAEIFSVLAREEVAHAQAFKALLKKVPDTAESSGDEKFQYLRAMSISEFFSSTRGVFADPDAIKSREDALQRALGLEKATLQYYQAMREVLDDSEVLDPIIAAEKRHVLNIMRYLMTEAQVRQISVLEDEGTFRK